MLNSIFRRLHSPEVILVSGFAVASVVGALLLYLPFSATNKSISFIDALFTAVSAVCVTGLGVVDTGKDFSMIGQTIILSLIQFGGLGVMTVASVVIFARGSKLSFSSERALFDALYQRSVANKLKSDIKKILLIVFSIQIVGAVTLYFGFSAGESEFPNWFSAIFHAVSAFCNAGFSLYSDSLISWSDNSIVMTAVSCLIILGGLGFPVLVELISYRKGSRLSFHTKLVLKMSVFLVIFGSLIIYLLDHAAGAIAGSYNAALFQSITARTAGFNSIDTGALSPQTLVFLMLLMFIGGAPASCAGGVKITAIALVWAFCRHIIGHNSQMLIGKRAVAVEVVEKALLLIIGAMLFNFIGVIFLLVSQGVANYSPLELAFEQISAFGTVGLSTGVTAGLDTWGKSWIILTMFVGRLGPLTVAFFLVKAKPAKVKYPEANIMIG